MHMSCCLSPGCDILSRVVMWVGSILMFLGYGGMWAQATHRIQPSLARMLICAVLAGERAVHCGRSGLK